MSEKKNKFLVSQKERNLFYAAFVVINLLLSCYYLDIWITPNTASRAIPVLTLYENKTLIVDKYAHQVIDVSQINNHYYSNKAPFSSFLVYPFYSLYKDFGLPELKDSTIKKYPIYILENIRPDFDGRSQILPKSATIFILGDILCGAIPFVITLLLSLFVLKRTSITISPVILVMLTFYSSFLFAYSGVYTGHILAGFFALCGYILLKRKKYLFSGIMAGLAMATEFPVGILIPVWAIAIYFNKNTNSSLKEKTSSALRFIAGVIPGLLFIFYYNYHLTGSIFTTSYSYEIHQHKQVSQDVGFYFPSFSAFWGLVFSTYRGVLYYAPILILMLWYVLKYGYETLQGKMSNVIVLIKSGMQNYLLVSIAAYLLLYSAYYEWDGGWSYGPRYLIPLVIIVLYEGVIFLSKKPFSTYLFYIIAGIGLLFTWMDKSTKIFEIPNNRSSFGNPVFNIIFPDFFKHKFNTSMLPVFLFDSNPVLAIYTWPILFIASVLILSLWYSRIYQLKKNKISLYFSIVPFFILYFATVIFSKNTGPANKLSLDKSGIYGKWEHFDLGETYMNAAKNSKDPKSAAHFFSLAASEYNKIIEFSPQYQDYYVYLGQCYFGMGYPDSAIYFYKRALALNPKLSIPAKKIGFIYSGRKQFDSAIYYFTLSYKADTNLGSIVDIGASYEQAGNYAKALHFDSLVLTKDKNNKTALNNLYFILNEIGKQGKRKPKN